MTDKTEAPAPPAEKMQDLTGRIIKRIRSMTEAELEAEGWSGNQPGLVIELSGGATLFASRDDEGNGPGTLFGSLDGTSIYVREEG